MCAADYDRERVLVVSSTAHVYLYSKDDKILMDCTVNFFADEPSNFVSAAAYKNDTLYILYSQASDVICYKWKSSDDYESAGTCTFEERTEKRGVFSEIGEAVESDDGKYIAVQGDDHSLRIYKASDKSQKNCLKSIYDITGVFCSMIKLEGTDNYILTYSGKFCYLLNKDLDVIARVAYFYDYSEDKESFILYHSTNDTSNYELYYVPVLSYEDIMEVAEEFTEDFEPSDELMERYGISER